MSSVLGAWKEEEFNFIDFCGNMLLTPAQIKVLKKPELLQYALSVSDIHTKLDEVVGTKLEEFSKNLAERFEAVEREFDEKLKELKKNSKDRFEKLEGELIVAKNANRLLAEEVAKDKVATGKQHVELEREVYRTAEYTQYETLEFNGIPLTIPDDEIPNLMLSITNSIKNEHSIDLVPRDIQACHRRQSQYARKLFCANLLGVDTRFKFSIRGCN